MPKKPIDRKNVLRLDLPPVDWGEVAELLVAAYRLQTPRKLAEQVA